MPNSKARRKATLRLNWEPQTENAGFFVGVWNGYYDEEGLTIDLKLPQSDISVTEQVAAGKDDFGLAEPVNVVLGRSKGLPIVEVGQIQHDSYLRYIAKRNRGIRELTDLKGKRGSLFFGGGEYEFIAMLQSVGLTQDQVNLVPQELHTMAPFFNDEVDMASVTLFNELLQVYEAGYSDEDLTIWSGKDFGVGLVAKGVFTSERLIRESPEAVQAFVNGSIRGWKYAREFPEQTSRMFVEHYPHLDYGKMLQMLHGFNGLAAYGNGTARGLGYIDPSYFETAKHVMNIAGLLDNDVPTEACYDNSFWENIPSDYREIS